MTAERQTIYFVTVFTLPKEYRDTKDEVPGLRSCYYKRKRCWGWYTDYEKAEKCILENWTDIYEVGYYDLAMIEPMREGICGYTPKGEAWFDVEYNEETGDYAVTRIEKPARFKGIVGWSYG